MRLSSLALAGLLVLTGCSSDSTGSATADPATGVTSAPSPTTGAPSDGSSDVRYPDVIAATATMGGEGTWLFSATVSSPYDSPERYADAWRVLAPDGTELGVRELGHDHASEQPFTRTLSGVVVPAGVDVVTVEGRDQVNGWGGATVEVELQP
ncbi:MAG: hypothetical protein OEV20_01935 [Actinomycetota bacterium]|nr:hypothetical protein [Actinomycetota bacterium]MDH4016078.1 hypothetical protein [Actinomycetota bacterium]